jgi:uncharacterized protein (DUF1499 family)
MNRLIKVLLVTIFTLNLIFVFPSLSWAAASNLGIENGALSPCPQSPNCVVSQNADEAHYIAPLVYHTDLDKAREIVLKVLTAVPRTQAIAQTPNYIQAESKSRIFDFIDDLEFYFPDKEKVIHVRSASRVGESDLGVNRRRVEQIRLALQDLNV